MHLVEVVLLLEVGKISITSRHVLESSFISGQIIRFYKKFLDNMIGTLGFMMIGMKYDQKQIKL